VHPLQRQPGDLRDHVERPVVTQIALGNRTGYSQAHISRWLHRVGNSEGVTAARLRQFVEGLGIPWALLGLIDPAVRESSVAVRRGSFGDGTVAEEEQHPMKRRDVRRVDAGGAIAAACLVSGSGGTRCESGAVPPLSPGSDSATDGHDRASGGKAGEKRRSGSQETPAARAVCRTAGVDTRGGD
jgi:transcriptional regulator with XRE-family HTH domain